MLEFSQVSEVAAQPCVVFGPLDVGMTTVFIKAVVDDDRDYSASNLEQGLLLLNLVDECDKVLRISMMLHPLTGT